VESNSPDFCLKRIPDTCYLIPATQKYDHKSPHNRKDGAAGWLLCGCTIISASASASLLSCAFVSFSQPFPSAAISSPSLDRVLCSPVLSYQLPSLACLAQVARESSPSKISSRASSADTDTDITKILRRPKPTTSHKSPVHTTQVRATRSTRHNSSKPSPVLYLACRPLHACAIPVHSRDLERWASQ
jgi:hypothetical protein